MEITEIKARLSLHTVLQHYNLAPDRNGMLRCPFHADDTASMKVYPNTNTFNCFGCGKNGDQIEFCTLKEGSKHKGILRAKELLNIAEIPISGATSGVKATELIGEIKPINEKPYRQGTALSHENHTEILTKIFEGFKSGLNHPVSVKPKEYLKGRGFSLPLLGEAGWGPGYNSGQFHHRGQLGETDKQACINAGLLIPYNGSVPNASGTTYTPFAKDCIIFPLKDHAGNIVSLYGRSISPSPALPEGKGAKHFYLKDRCGLYPGYPNPNTTKLILTEAIIDTASLLQIPEITAEYEILSCYGTNGLTEEHKTAIKGLINLEEIIFFFDGDKAGQEAAQKYAHELRRDGLPSVSTTYNTVSPKR